MLDPRIYRSGLVAVAVALIVVAFSLTDQQGPVGSNLPPEAFNGQNAYLDMVGMARKYPQRAPGSPGDDALAVAVARALAKDGYAVSTRTDSAQTATGRRPLQTVTGVLAGQSTGSIVVVAHRDTLSSPGTSDLSGTAVLLELARVLAGQTQHRSVVLVSTSGSAGTVGATEAARRLARPVDAVIALGDLAGMRMSPPLISPFSNGQPVAPTMLRNTLAAQLASQAGLLPGDTGLLGQFAHLAFPLTLTEQGPFGARGVPSVLLSLSGERPAPAGEAVDPGRITNLGRTVLATVNALDAGPSVPAPSAYLLLSGKVVPDWAVRVLVLALILPVLMATVDALARARRRGHHLLPWVGWVLGAALPFVVGMVLALGARLTGAVSAAPPGPVAAGAVRAGAGGTAVLIAVLAAIVLAFAGWRAVGSRLMHGGPARGAPNPGAAPALLLVLCAVAVVIWVQNPFAAAMLIPALHLWLWLNGFEEQLPRGAAVALVLGGLALPVLVVVFYAVTLGLGPVALLWNGFLLVAGGYVGALAALQWSVVLGCVACAVSLAARWSRATRARVEEQAVTVRGPVTYAGPGSLGGTESAIRR